MVRGPTRYVIDQVLGFGKMQQRATPLQNNQLCQRFLQGRIDTTGKLKLERSPAWVVVWTEAKRAAVHGGIKLCQMREKDINRAVIDAIPGDLIAGADLRRTSTVTLYMDIEFQERLMARIAFSFERGDGVRAYADAVLSI